MHGCLDGRVSGNLEGPFIVLPWCCAVPVQEGLDVSSLQAAADAGSCPSGPQFHRKWLWSEMSCLTAAAAGPAVPAGSSGTGGTKRTTGERGWGGGAAEEAALGGEAGVGGGCAWWAEADAEGLAGPARLEARAAAAESVVSAVLHLSVIAALR